MKLVLQLVQKSGIIRKTALRARAREIKKSAYFVTFILSEVNFYKICVFIQCIAY